jgi:hypothetical protein
MQVAVLAAEAIVGVEGEPFLAEGGEVAIDPLLAEPPELDFDCMPGDAVGDRHETSTSVHVEAGATLNVDRALRE